jgi:hypothetical protein
MAAHSGETALDPVEVNNAATAIGELAADVNGFSELNDVHPNPGEFAVGDWLKQLIVARRDELYAHCNKLSQTLQEMSRSLKHIASEIEATDTRNGEQMKKLHAELESTVSGMHGRIGGETYGLLPARPAEEVTSVEGAEPVRSLEPMEPVERSPAEEAVLLPAREPAEPASLRDPDSQ